MYNKVLLTGRTTLPKFANTAFVDAFRGLAAFWVVLAHCAIWSGIGVADVLEPKKAVDLFMVISGFLMFHTIDRSLGDRGAGTRPGWPFWRRFYLRRFLRIAPTYYVALAAVILLSVPMSSGYVALQAYDPVRWAGAQAGHVVRPGDHGVVDLLLHIAFLFGLVPGHAGSSGLPDWSLSLEMQFYAVFPLVYLAGRRWGVGRVCLALAVIAALLSHGLSAAIDRGAIRPFGEPSPLPIRFPMFMVGCLLYETGRARRPSLFAVAATVLFLGCRLYGGWSAALLAFSVGALAYIWIAQPRGMLEMLLRSAPVRFMSDTSYGLYLFHGFCLSILGSRVMAALGPGRASAAVMTLVVVVAAYGLALLVFRLVERPGIKAAKRLLRSPEPLGAPMT